MTVPSTSCLTPPHPWDNFSPFPALNGRLWIKSVRSWCMGSYKPRPHWQGQSCSFWESKIGVFTLVTTGALAKQLFKTTIPFLSWPWPLRQCIKPSFSPFVYNLIKSAKAMSGRLHSSLLGHYEYLTYFSRYKTSWVWPCTNDVEDWKLLVVKLALE